MNWYIINKHLMVTYIIESLCLKKTLNILALKKNLSKKYLYCHLLQIQHIEEHFERGEDGAAAAGLSDAEREAQRCREEQEFQLLRVCCTILNNRLKQNRFVKNFVLFTGLLYSFHNKVH